MPSRAKRARLVPLGLLALLSVVFLAYSAIFVPHLVNNHFGDVEFTGWSGPMGMRLLAGDRPYVDFILPIPPGSFLVLAGIAKLAGGPRMVHELWLNAVCHLGMGLLAYATTVKITTRFNALLVALVSLVTVIELNKEIAYDHTALLLVWASLATGVRALLAPAGRRRSWLWLVTGVLASLTIGFKQSTGLGAVFGWLLALGYLAAVSFWSQHSKRLRPVLEDGAAYLLGAVLGLLVVWGALLALGADLASFFQAVFVDGPAVKGGTAFLLVSLFRYLFVSEAFPPTLTFVAALAVLGALLVRYRGSLHIGDEPERDVPIDRLRIVAYATAVLLPFGLAAVLLLSSVSQIPEDWRLWFDRLKVVPMLGYAFAIGFFVAHLARPITAGKRDSAWVGHAVNALFVAALVASLLHNTSAPEFRTFYDNNPIIPLLFMAFFVGLDRARQGWLKALVVVVTLSTLFGNKLDRALQARTPAGSGHHWAGLMVNPRGERMLQAAARVREVTQPGDTVLVLPEDVAFAALIGRPRPKLRGAIVYVDQYPRRLLAQDRQALRDHPPKVIVTHPQEIQLWAQVFRTWSGDSAAEDMLRFVLTELLPEHYRRDRAYPTRFLWTGAKLQIWVRKD